MAHLGTVRCRRRSIAPASAAGLDSLPVRPRGRALADFFKVSKRLRSSRMAAQFPSCHTNILVYRAPVHKEIAMVYQATKKSKYCYTVEDIPLVPLTELSSTRFIAAGPALLSFIKNPPGCVFPMHKHEAVQILIILEGSEEHVCGGETFLMEAGDVCVHPSNAMHGGKTSTGFRGIDIFVPPREDYLKLMAQHGLPIVGPIA
jgi:mannose-6-phosphate isomerase-like protein (cupin superfamily)